MAWNILFYEKASGKKPIEEFLDDLPKSAKAKCLSYINIFKEQGFNLPQNYLEKVDDNIWALRPESGGNEYRIFFSRTSEKETIVITHAIHKNTRRLTSKDWDMAKRRRDEITANKK